MIFLHQPFLKQETLFLRLKNQSIFFHSNCYTPKLSLSLITILLVSFISIQADAQVRNLYVEGNGDQYGVIHTNSTGSSKAGIELLRSTAFSGTDWRIQNSSGDLEFIDGLDNFATPGDLNMSIFTGGTVSIYNGSDAVVDANNSGVLILGNQSSYHMALDDNGIIARNNESGADLLLQTGLNTGNTFLNSVSGEVGIGTIAPQAKLGVEDSGFQLRLANRTQTTNQWYMGASNESWLVGGNSLVIGPSSSSSGAMLILNKVNNTISARSNRIISVDDPIDDQDAVNLRTLNDASFLAPKQISVASPNATFAGCAGLCRNKTDSGYTDWTIPSVAQASHFVGTIGIEHFIWTSDVEISAYAHNANPNTSIVLPSVSKTRLKLDLDDGAIDNTTSTDNQNALGTCRCVR